MDPGIELHHYVAFVLGMVTHTTLAEEHCHAAFNIVLRVPGLP